MKRKFRNIALAFAVTTLGLATCGLIGAQTVSATGDVTPDITNDDYRAANFFVDGYSVRIPNGTDDEHGYGVRFYVRMTQELYAALPADATTGTLFLPESLLGDDNALTVEDTTAWNCPTTDKWYEVTENDVSYMESVVYCYNIPAENYGSDIAVVGYVQVDGAYYYSAGSEARSMSWVAKAEYNNENSKLDATQKAELKAEYLDCTVTLDGEEYATVMYGEKITEPKVENWSAEKSYYYANVTYSGCYNMANNAKWDFENDVVVGDVNLQTFSKDVTDLGVLEDFSAFDSYTNVRTTSNKVGKERGWEPSKTDSNGVTKYGVAYTTNIADATTTTYYNYFATVSATKETLKYHLGDNAENWYYESAMIMIEGTGTITAYFYGNVSQVIQRGVWTEINLYKSQIEAKTAGYATRWGEALTENTNQGQYLFHLGNGYSEDIRVYFDEIKINKGVAITTSAANDSFAIGSEITVTGDYNGNGTELNASAFQSVSYTYTAKDPSGNDVTVSADGKFTPTMSGVYKVTATATVVDLAGQSETASSTVSVAVYADNEINGFHTAADAANCGIKSSSNRQNTAMWHETYQNASGVLQLDGLQTGEYSNFYIDADPRWDATTLGTYLTEHSSENDYIAITMWIVDNDTTDGKTTVSVGTRAGSIKDVKMGEWQTIEISIKTLLEKRSATAADWTSSNEYMFHFSYADFGTFTAENNVTVYVDSIEHIVKNA